MTELTPPWEQDLYTVNKKKLKKSGKNSGEIKRIGKHNPDHQKTPGGGRSYKAAYANGPDHGNSKYDPSYADRLRKHFKKKSANENTGQVVFNGEISIGLKEAIEYPTIAGFCVKEGIGKMTYHRWAYDVDEDGHPKYPGFYEANDYAKQVQEDLLLKNGLAGLYNTSMTKLVLNINHGMIPKTSSDINLAGSINITIDSDDADL